MADNLITLNHILGARKSLDKNDFKLAEKCAELAMDERREVPESIVRDLSHVWAVAHDLRNKRSSESLSKSEESRVVSARNAANRAVISFKEHAGIGVGGAK